MRVSAHSMELVLIRMSASYVNMRTVATLKYPPAYLTWAGLGQQPWRIETNDNSGQA